MSGVAVLVQNVSKKYRLGANQNRYQTLRESIVSAASWPVSAARSIVGTTPPHTGRRRPEFWALTDVTFRLAQGEVLGIIGRNGAGKSTLLKILSQITEPTAGYVRTRGRVASLLEVGTGFHPELTGGENIFLSGAILGMQRAEIRRKFNEIVAFAEVEKFVDTPVKHYSSGMYLRLAFAVAAHLEPEILLVDEVLAVGDAAFQKKCLSKVEQVGQQGRTVIFVTHDMSAITRLCERAIWLDKGHILADGLSHQVVSTYLQSGSGRTAVREWPDLERAPGNETARLRSVRILDSAGIVRDDLDIREPVMVEVQYDSTATDSFPYVVIQLWDANNQCVFVSGDFVNPDWRHHRRDCRGRVISTVTIPGNFLSEGLKRVLVGLVTHNPTEELATERDAVAFLVVDRSEGDGARGEYAGEIPGVVRPLLPWQVIYHRDDGTTLNIAQPLRDWGPSIPAPCSTCGPARPEISPGARYGLGGV